MRKNSKIAGDIADGAMRLRTYLEGADKRERAMVRALAGFVYHQCVGDNKVYRNLFNNPEYAPKMISTQLYRALSDTRDKNCLRPTRAGSRFRARSKPMSDAPAFIRRHLERLRMATELWIYTCGLRLYPDSRQDIQRAWATLDIGESGLMQAFVELRDIEARNESLMSRGNPPRDLRTTDDRDWMQWCEFRPLFT